MKQSQLVKNWNKILFIDFETQTTGGRHKLKIFGLDNYLGSSRVLSLAYAVGNEPVKVWKDGDKPLKFKKFYAICAWNMFFDYNVWQRVFNSPFPKCDYLLDPSVYYRYLSLPGSLEDASQEVLSKKYWKDAKLGREVLNKISWKTKRRDGSFVYLDTSKETLNELYKYNKQDVEALRKLMIKLKNPKFMSPKEFEYVFEVAEIDWQMNNLGIKIDVNKTKKLAGLYDYYLEKDYEKAYKKFGINVRSTQQFKEILNKELRKLEDEKGIEFFPDKILPEVDLFSNNAINDCKAQTLDDILKVKGVTKKIKELIHYRRLLNARSGNRFLTAYQLQHKGIIRNSLVAFRAHTGRWGGRGIQPQNLPRSECKEPVSEIIKNLKTKKDKDWADKFKSVLPTIIIPHSPNDLIIKADYTAIELRVCFILTNCMLGIKAINNNEDVYENLAKKIFNKNVINKDERWVAKQATLACQYGCGIERFKNIVRPNFSTSSEEYINELANKSVSDFRNLYFEVVVCWNDIQKILQKVLRKSDKLYSKTMGDLQFYMERKDVLCIGLPSGHVLRYRGFEHNEEGEVFYDGGKLWGGIVLENIVSSLSFSILKEKMIALRNRFGDKFILFCVHDEIVMQCQKKDYNYIKEEAKAIMESRKGTWYEKVKLDVVFETGRFYKK